MRTKDKNGVEKIVPKKYKPILYDAVFESKSKRLTPTERHALLVRLIKDHFNTPFISNAQDEYAAQKVKEAESITVVKCIKRSGTDWRIKASGVEIRVSEDLVDDCPKEFLEVKHEF